MFGHRARKIEALRQLADVLQVAESQGAVFRQHGGVELETLERRLGERQLAVAQRSRTGRQWHGRPRRGQKVVGGARQVLLGNLPGAGAHRRQHAAQLAEIVDQEGRRKSRFGLQVGGKFMMTATADQEGDLVSQAAAQFEQLVAELWVGAREGDRQRDGEGVNRARGGGDVLCRQVTAQVDHVPTFETGGSGGQQGAQLVALAGWRGDHQARRGRCRGDPPQQTFDERAHLEGGEVFVHLPQDAGVPAVADLAHQRFDDFGQDPRITQLDGCAVELVAQLAAVEPENGVEIGGELPAGGRKIRRIKRGRVFYERARGGRNRRAGDRRGDRTARAAGLGTFGLAHQHLAGEGFAASLDGVGLCVAPIFFDQGLQLLVRKLGDLADRPAGAGGLAQQAQPLDFGVGVETVTADGAFGLDGVVPPLPGADQIGLETGTPRDDADRMAGQMSNIRRFGHGGTHSSFVQVAGSTLNACKNFDKHLTVLLQVVASFRLRTTW